MTYSELGDLLKNSTVFLALAVFSSPFAVSGSISSSIYKSVTSDGDSGDKMETEPQKQQA